jgi:hypothetical protein
MGTVDLLKEDDYCTLDVNDARGLYVAGINVAKILNEEIEVSWKKLYNSLNIDRISCKTIPQDYIAFMSSKISGMGL